MESQSWWIKWTLLKDIHTEHLHPGPRLHCGPLLLLVIVQECWIITSHCDGQVWSFSWKQRVWIWYSFLVMSLKVFIHKCRFKSKPIFNRWLNEVKLICNSLKFVKTSKPISWLQSIILNSPFCYISLTFFDVFYFFLVLVLLWRFYFVFGYAQPRLNKIWSYSWMWLCTFFAL